MFADWLNTSTSMVYLAIVHSNVLRYRRCKQALYYITACIMYMYDMCYFRWQKFHKHMDCQLIFMNSLNKTEKHHWNHALGCWFRNTSISLWNNNDWVNIISNISRGKKQRTSIRALKRASKKWMYNLIWSSTGSSVTSLEYDPMLMVDYTNVISTP